MAIAAQKAKNVLRIIKPVSGVERFSTSLLIRQNSCLFTAPRERLEKEPFPRSFLQPVWRDCALTKNDSKYMMSG